MKSDSFTGKSKVGPWLKGIQIQTKNFGQISLSLPPSMKAYTNILIPVNGLCASGAINSQHKMTRHQST